MKGIAYHGRECVLPDKFWPVTLDNFFDNPDEIRKLGLRMIGSDKVVKSADEDGIWPGYRSEQLWKIDKKLTQGITERILSCYFNLDFEKVFWNMIEMNFQSIPNFDKDKNNIKNKGWIHSDVIDPREQHNPEKDQQAELAGLIYLTPDIERDSGTSLFNVKKGETLENWRETRNLRREIHLGNPISDEEIENGWEKHRSCFIEKVRFENIYNRLIMYDAGEWHSANSVYSSKDSRLTLVFFIGGILVNKWPLERVRQVKIC